MTQNSCPKCSFSVDPRFTECPRCGIVFGKMSDPGSSPTQQVLASSDLIGLWQNLVQNYQEEEKHELFLQEAMSKQKLSFASQQYRKMLELNPEDEIAKRMQEKIIQLASLQALFKPSNKKTSIPKWVSFVMLFSSMALFSGFLLKNPMAQLLGVLGFAVSIAVIYFRLRREKE